MNLNVVDRTEDLVPLRNAIVSVADKSELAEFAVGLCRICPELRIYSTGGTLSALQKALGPDAAEVLRSVSDYTGQPEMQGGLVKTLDFRIYLGLLSETFNPDHARDLERAGATTFDLVVVNLYPFRQAIAADSSTLETARGNIDIGGPCMLRAAAKNFLRVAAVCDPSDFPLVLEEARANSGRLSVATRFALARKAFAHTAAYDTAISDYLQGKDTDEPAKTYRLIRP
jgi:phosphoribosylaminoimidazolecarboxamide formyltransferase/IMP cyclohydrolase